jgi:hypothetical protein
LPALPELAEPRRARRVIVVLGFTWNATILIVVLFSEWPNFWKATVVAYGGFALVMFGRTWTGKDDAPSLRLWQLAAFFIADTLFAIGAFVYRS